MLLKPGSDEAYEAGCTCPRMDNAYGLGYLGGVLDDNGDTVFVMTLDCPLHGDKTPPSRPWEEGGGSLLSGRPGESM